MFPDSYQLSAIQSRYKDAIVLAGAGCGKTRTLLAKMLYQISEGTAPDRILVLTFTNAASDSMKAKYKDLTFEGEDLRAPNIRTFHSFCYQVLSDSEEAAKALGYSCVPRVADEDETSWYEKRARKVTGFRGSLNANTYSGSQRRKLENFLQVLRADTRKHCVIGYNELSSEVCRLFKEKHASVEQFLRMYDCLFVDEFQDCDPSEYELVKSMSRCRRTLTGDVLQNIYQFRGCTNEPLKGVLSDPAWKQYVLPVTYRFTKQICSFVNQVSENFRASDYRVKLKSNSEGPRVRICTCSCWDQETDAVFNVCKKFSNNGSCAVLCRSNSQVDDIASYLTDRGFACITKLFDVNPSKLRAAQLVLSKIEREDGAELCEDGSKIEDERLPNEIRHMYLCAMDAMRAPVDQCSFVVCNMFGVIALNPSAKSKTDLMRHVVSELSCQSGSANYANVYVGTVHSVKGLEFDSVVVSGVGSKCFKINGEENENILYTACTRAKKNLIVFYES